MEVNTTEQLRSLLSDNTFDFRFACGYTKPTHQIQLNDKEEFANSIWLHHVLFSPYAELEQLWKGFQETLQIQLLVCVHREAVRALLAYSALFNVTVVYLQDAFAIQYSDNGSNKRTQEEAIVFHWFEYISNCEGNVQDYLTPSPCQLHAKPYIMFALCCDLYLNSGQLRNGSFC